MIQIRRAYDLAAPDDGTRFLNETARYADVVLPGSLHEEDEGTVTSVEGRVIKTNKAVNCPDDAREDWRIIQDIASALGRGKSFHL